MVQPLAIADDRKAVVETKDLVRIYSGDGVATAALNGASLKIFDGEFFFCPRNGICFSGPSMLDEIHYLFNKEFHDE